jgi:acetoacetyl-CoA synthetase
MARVRRTRGLAIDDYPGLYRWSIERPDEFWAQLWEFCGVRAARTGQTVLAEADAMPGARWFPEARLNFAENLLRRRDTDPALIFRSETGERTQLSFAEVHAQVGRLASFLSRLGVGPGDRVAGLLPNRPEAVIAMLASARIGAIWSACSPDFGAAAVLDRFGQIQPRVLFCADGYWFKGKPIDTRERVARIVTALPSIERTVVVPWLHPRPAIAAIGQTASWSEAIADEGQPPPFAQLPFDHPLYALFSSGTTGKPKCIVHGAGGTLLQHLKELVLHTDLRPGDRFFYYTTCSWMMWNWLVSGLAVGATLVLYDGSPLYPGATALFDLAEQERVAIFGASAKYLSALANAGAAPGRSHDLSALRTLLSTGSPLAPELFDFVYRDIKSDIQLSSISGGTDIVSCFALGNPMLPVYRGELQCRGLGMNVQVFDAAGRPTRGQKGELVCTAPFPSMPVGFWNDPGGARYHAAYFERFPGVWAHGDYAELTPHDGLIIHGRSDAVLNPGGVRIGTGEIYRPVEALPEVIEALAVGQDWGDDQRVILFVVLDDGLSLDEALTARIKGAIRSGASPRHVPAKVLQVPAMPHTVSGKIVELAVRETIHGRAVVNRDALANPEALEHFRDLAELRT